MPIESINTARAELEQMREGGSPQPEKLPRSLPLAQIGELPELFQHRQPLPHASEAHATVLARHLTNNKVSFDPITVFWSGAGWVTVDGHHRLMAYRMARWRDAVPVLALPSETTLDEAIALAAECNSKARLQMSNSERTCAAWRLVVGTSTLTRKKIASVSGVSLRTVALMRDVRKRLEAMDSECDVGGLSWHEARRKAEGGEESEQEDWEKKRMEQAKKIADTLVKALGPHRNHNHEVLAEALAIYDQRLPNALCEYWGVSDGDDDFDLPSRIDPDAEF